MKHRTWTTQLAHEKRPDLAYIATRYGVSRAAARRAVASHRGAHSASASWRAIAHAAQLPPQGAWSTWLFQGGRGAGKARAGAEWLAARAEASPNGAFALIGPTQHDVREVMIDGVSGLCSLPGRIAPRFESSRQRLVWPNGAIAHCFSAQEPERLRGPQFEAAWADEFCVWPKPAATLANLRLALRRGPHPQLVVTTTPKPLVSLRKLRAKPHCVTTQAPTALNAAHLSPTFLDHVRALHGGTRLEAQELEGLIVDAEGALFSAEHFARARAAARPSLTASSSPSIRPRAAPVRRAASLSPRAWASTPTCSKIVMTGIIIITFATVHYGFRALAKNERRGIRHISDPAGLPLIFGLVAVIGIVTTPIQRNIIYFHEQQADMFGLNAAREPDGFAEASVLLSEYRKMEPSTAEEWFFYDHPSGWNRVHNSMVWKAHEIAAGRLPNTPGGPPAGWRPDFVVTREQAATPAASPAAESD